MYAEDVLSFIGLALAVVFLVWVVVVVLSDHNKPDPFTSLCTKQGGQVATFSHGKSHDSLCIKGNTVLFRA